MSASACVGCSPAPSPALITGTGEAAAATAAVPCSKWRITIASAYPLTTRTVSAMVSPLTADELSRAFSTLNTLPPSFCMAASNDSRVRVLGS